MPAVASEPDVLIVHVAGHRVGLPLADVVEVLPAVTLTVLPDAPPVIRGVVNLRGAPLPVLSLRERLGLDQIEPAAEHHLVVCAVAGRSIGVWVDSANAVAPVDRGSLRPATELAAARHLAGVALRPDGLILVYDVRSFLDADDALRIEAALTATTATTDGIRELPP